MTGHFLVLYPKNPAWALQSPAMLAGALKTIGFLGAERSPGVYSAGPDYLDLMTYLGCSPQVTLGDNEAATVIRISGVLDAPQFLQGGNLKSPRCPQCRNSLQKPPAVQSANALLQCPHCGHAGQLHRFDWRRSAACARLFVEVSNVFESEAVPGETLADCLEQATGEAWDYCYVRKAG
jgi:hypothetical protein